MIASEAASNPPIRGFTVTLLRDGHVLASWSTDALDPRLGARIADEVARRVDVGVILCAARTISIGQLHGVVAGFDGKREVVACLPDRRNCPAACP